jgi:hypothetical protein
MPRRAGLLLAVLAVLAIAASASAAVVQEGNLRVTVLSRVAPFKLPRNATAPISVFLAGHVATVNGEVPPQLQTLTIDVNRHGLLQSQGLPTCPLARIKTSSTGRSLANCGEALIGSGRFWASVVFPDQRPYPTHGRLLIFNGRSAGKPAIFAHIYTSIPFPTSFVIPFTIKHVSKGPYGTELSAELPSALGNWGFVNRIKLTLERKYTRHGQDLSYFNAGCPAPAGARTASFSLAQATLTFDGAGPLALDVEKSCRVAE